MARLHPAAKWESISGDLSLYEHLISCPPMPYKVLKDPRSEIPSYLTFGIQTSSTVVAAPKLKS